MLDDGPAPLYQEGLATFLTWAEHLDMNLLSSFDERFDRMEAMRTTNVLNKS
jgi:hypothetical protein